MTDPFEANRTMWNAWTKLHEKSSFYDVESFREGQTSLKHVELEEMGAVNGLDLLHLQCHFGLDTLSWGRLGAQVTGVDIAEEAINLARNLAEDIGVAATFIAANVLNLPDHLDRQFDRVFTSYGALNWIPDLSLWAQVVNHFLKPGGCFYLVEFHPLMSMLDDDGERFAYPYRQPDEALAMELTGSYAAPDATETHTCFEWFHGIGDIVTALASQGLRIDFLHEFLYSSYPCYPYLEADGPERYVWRGQPNSLPLMYSIQASKISL